MPLLCAELYEKPELVDDFDRVIGDAMVDLYTHSIVDDPQMESLLEFGNYIIEGIIPDVDLEIPTIESTREYINDAYIEEAEVDDEDNDDNTWVRLYGTNKYKFVNTASSILCKSNDWTNYRK